DARADLYALGCILYEVICGRPPFLSDGTGAIFDLHLNAAPPPPSHFTDRVPAALDHLVLRMLEKRPPDRLGYADDVAAALAEHGAGGWTDSDAPPARPYLYRAAFAGRGDVFDELVSALDDARAGAGGCALIGGESGVGKTRL